MAFTPHPVQNSPAELVVALLREGTPATFRAGGPSMTPFITDGDPVQVRPLRNGDLRPGAVLLYHKNNRLILHRLIGRNRTTGALILSGDAALQGAEAVDAGQVAGIAATVQHARRTIRLDTPAARFRGRLWYRLRPLRRILHALLQAAHTKTSPE